jgi:SAM-dependent methyltransferase
VDFPRRKNLSGLGLTDWEGYSSALAEKFAYINTYFDREPRLDISATDISPERRAAYDFIISSEVFEHVVPPVDMAFRNVYEMLKPGALFVLTVPYGLQLATIEHFPELHQFSVAERIGVYQLDNVTKTGVKQSFKELVFHGGPGSTLEMRVFAQSDLLRHLTEAGFENITTHATPDFSHGIWWPEPWSWPITSRKPNHH